VHYPENEICCDVMRCLGVSAWPEASGSKMHRCRTSPAQCSKQLQRDNSGPRIASVMGHARVAEMSARWPGLAVCGSPAFGFQRRGLSPQRRQTKCSVETKIVERRLIKSTTNYRNTITLGNRHGCVICRCLPAFSGRARTLMGPSNQATTNRLVTVSIS